jgi:hypothetical protein
MCVYIYIYITYINFQINYIYDTKPNPSKQIDCCIPICYHTLIKRGTHTRKQMVFS